MHPTPYSKSSTTAGAQQPSTVFLVNYGDGVYTRRPVSCHGVYLHTNVIQQEDVDP